MATVVFDYAEWLALFPGFGVNQVQAQFAFDLACGMLDPTDCSLVNPEAFRKQCLYVLTAHISQLAYGLDGKSGAMSAGGAPSGRVTSASEGSVSVSFGDLGAGESPGAAWYQQTPWGALYWQLTAGYRTMRYFVGPQPIFDRIYPGHPPFYRIPY